MLTSHDAFANTSTHASISSGQDTVSTRTPLEAVTSVINNLMVSTETLSNKRKRVIDRPYGESLTAIDAILKVNEKENQSKKRKAAKEKTKVPVVKKTVRATRYVNFSLSSNAFFKRIPQQKSNRTSITMFQKKTTGEDMGTI
jgi:hypothetical protein